MRHGGARALLDHDRYKVAKHRVLGGRRDALIRQYTGEEHGFSVQSAQDQFQIGAVERALAIFLYEPVLFAGAQLVEQFITPGVLTQAAVFQERP